MEHLNRNTSSQDLSNNKIHIYINSKKNPIGQVEGGTFYKQVRGSIHFLRFPPGIAFDVSSLVDAQKAGAIWVNVADSETGIQYIATIQRIFEKGLKFNRGHGEQIVLIFSEWKKLGKDLFQQPSLFDDGGDDGNDN